MSQKYSALELEVLRVVGEAKTTSDGPQWLLAGDFITVFPSITCSGVELDAAINVLLKNGLIIARQPERDIFLNITEKGKTTLDELKSS